MAAYDAIVESDDSDLPENFKSSAYAKYENCLDQFEETKAMISDQLKLIKEIALVKFRHASQGARM